MEKGYSQDESEMRVEEVVLGGGCFWCTEAVFERMQGVIDVCSGYMGGTVSNPTYEQVCRGDTGHAEVIRIRFDPDAVTFRELLDVFWQAHDPTTLNRQGADVGSQYRSVIFYPDEPTRAKAEASIKDAQNLFSSPIVTKLEPSGLFYEAESYHQDFYANNRDYPYCRMVIAPKLKKLGRKP